MSDAAAESGVPADPGTNTAARSETEPRSDIREPRSEADALLSRLLVIEDQPLDSRATAFTQLHEELQQRLEGGDSSGSHG